MTVKRLFKYYVLNEPLKQIEMNNILEKVSKKIKLTDREANFLRLYNQTREDRDFMLLSKNTVYKKVKDFLSKERVVICDLTDRDGRIGSPIIDIKNDIESDFCQVYMKSGLTKELHDKYLYNLIYNNRKNYYSLQEHDEYYEKIEANND